MALIKKIAHDSGAEAEYWKVIEVSVNYFANVGGIALAGYVSKAARLAGKRPLDARQFQISGDGMAAFTPEALSGEGKNPVKAAYQFLKAAVPAEGQPENPFADAVDDV